MESADRADSRAISSFVAASVGAGNSDGVAAVAVTDDAADVVAPLLMTELLLLWEQAVSGRLNAIPSEADQRSAYRAPECKR